MAEIRCQSHASSIYIVPHAHIDSVLLHDLQPRLDFSAFILLDPTLGRESAAKDRMQRILTQLTWCKRDVWPSRKAAHKDLSSQPGLRNWHPEVLELYVVCNIFYSSLDVPQNSATGSWSMPTSSKQIHRSLEFHGRYISVQQSI